MKTVNWPQEFPLSYQCRSDFHLWLQVFPTINLRHGSGHAALASDPIMAINAIFCKVSSRKAPFLRSISRLSPKGLAAVALSRAMTCQIRSTSRSARREIRTLMLPRRPDLHGGHDGHETPHLHPMSLHARYCPPPPSEALPFRRVQIRLDHVREGSAGQPGSRIPRLHNAASAAGLR